MTTDSVSLEGLGDVRDDYLKAKMRDIIRRDNIRDFVHGIEACECWPYPNAQNGHSKAALTLDEVTGFKRVVLKPSAYQALKVFTLEKVLNDGEFCNVTIKLLTPLGMGTYEIAFEKIERNDNGRVPTVPTVTPSILRTFQHRHLERYLWVASKICYVNAAREDAYLKHIGLHEDLGTFEVAMAWSEDLLEGDAMLDEDQDLLDEDQDLLDEDQDLLDEDQNLLDEDQNLLDEDQDLLDEDQDLLEEDQVLLDDDMYEYKEDLEEWKLDLEEDTSEDDEIDTGESDSDMPAETASQAGSRLGIGEAPSSARPVQKSPNPLSSEKKALIPEPDAKMPAKAMLGARYEKNVPQPNAVVPRKRAAAEDDHGPTKRQHPDGLLSELRNTASFIESIGKNMQRGSQIDLAAIRGVFTAMSESMNTVAQLFTGLEEDSQS